MTSKQSCLEFHSRVGLGTFVLAAAAAIACSSATPPDSPPAGDAYDVTTVLDSFSFETGGPSPPDCTYQYTMYCTHLRAYSGATLSGVLYVVMDAPPRTGSTGHFSGRMCSDIDYVNLTGCKGVTSRSDDYEPYSFARLSDGSIQVTIAVDEFQLEPYITFTGNFGADSVSGRVVWAASITRGPPTHIGRFVARRRK